jgi:hypothetical protein
MLAISAAIEDQHSHVARDAEHSQSPYRESVADAQQVEHSGEEQRQVGAQDPDSAGVCLRHEQALDDREKKKSSRRKGGRKASWRLCSSVRS